MTELSHRQARWLIQQSDRSAEEQVLLAQHLRSCIDCAGYADMHQLLSRQLKVAPVRSYPHPAERIAILERVGRTSPWLRLQQGIATAGMLAALVLVVFAAWYLFQFQAPAEMPGTAATIVASPAPQPTAAPTPLPTATAEPTPEGPQVRWEVRTIPAPSLANSILGEPAEQPVVVYLPPSYDTSSKRYPVLFLLPDFDEPLTDRNKTDLNTPAAVLTFLLHEDRIQEMILVMPNGENVLGLDSFYVNSPVNGNWEDFIVKDVLSYVDREFRTLAGREFRGVTGQGMGGFGALHLAFRHPDLFGAVYAVSPALFAPGGFEKSTFVSDHVRSPVIDLIDELSALPREEAHTRYLDFLHDNRTRWDLPFVLSYGAAFAPNPDGNAPYFAYAFQDNEVQASDAVWRQWEDGLGSISDNVAAYTQSQPKLDAIGLGYDVSDAYAWMKDGVGHLADQLSMADIPFTLDKYDEIPGFAFRLRDEILPFFSQSFTSNGS